MKQLSLAFYRKEFPTFFAEYRVWRGFLIYLKPNSGGVVVYKYDTSTKDIVEIHDDPDGSLVSARKFIENNLWGETDG